MEHFKQFANLESIDRKAVAILIKHIKIFGKREIEIEFNYKAEYDAALEIVKKGVA
jgi:uncharacterized HAD superfamily protein